MNSKSTSNRFKPPALRTNIWGPIYGQVWNTKKTKYPQSKVLPVAKQNFLYNKKAKPLHLPRDIRNDAEQKLDSLLHLDSLSKQKENIEERPTSIYRYNNREFLHSLRNFNERAITFRTTSLARYMKMSREIVDDFVKLKSNESEQKIQVTPIDAKINHLSPTVNISKSFKKNANVTKKRNMRPKSAISSRRRTITNGVSKSNSKLNKLKSYSDEEIDQNEIDDNLKPLFHRSMDKISSIANWERQIRYELEIDKELQKREIERQREKLQNDQRKLEDWDKQLRIELDARERKLRLAEDELKGRLEEFNQKTNELIRREQIINEIVNERIKTEMKFEIEKLRKKFNELEIDKNNLTKKEERVKEVEARLHEQVKIVKEKIDRKRMSDIELAKYRKELEITKKENEVLKEKVDSMEDYQITKFENRAFKNELQILKETLDSKNQELERDRERWEREQRFSDQKIMSLKRDLRKAEQKLILLKQKSQADNEEITSKYEAANGQVKRLQLFIKDHLTKLNNDYSSTTQILNQLRHQTSFSNKTNHQISHHRGHSLYHVPNSYSHNRSYDHQRSISMDGFNKQHLSQARGCLLCNDDENEDDYNNNKFRNEIICRMSDYSFHDEEEADHLIPGSDNNEQLKIELNNRLNTSIEPEKNCDLQNADSDEFVRKIVDKIYEKMSHKVPEVTIDNEIQMGNSQDNNMMHKPDERNPNSKESVNILNNDNVIEKSLVNALESPSLNFEQTPVHLTLYEELLLASELENRNSKTNNKINEQINTMVPNSTIPESQNLSPFGDFKNFPKLQANDTNNNRINSEQTKNATTNSVVNNNSGDSHSSKSESFEIDW